MPFHLKHGGSFSVSGHYPEKSVLSGSATIQPELGTALLGETKLPRICHQVEWKHGDEYPSNLLKKPAALV
jgi:hypothetical protein